jgi:predicted SnoaL-like aldol condensation-catalyzing enzyme
MNAAEVHRKIVDLYLAGRVDEALLLIDPEAIDHRGRHGDHVGVDTWRAKWAGMTPPDLTIEQNVSQGDFSVNRYTMRGPGYAVTGIDMVRVRDGRIAEHWAVMDTAAMSAGQSR